jgi:antirestriction protein ArdC
VGTGRDEGIRWILRTKNVGVHVKKGEEATYVTLFKFFPMKDKTTGAPLFTATGKPKTVPLLRLFPIFNAEQMSAPSPESLLGIPHPFGFVNALLEKKGSKKRETVTTKEELLEIADKFVPAKVRLDDSNTREEIAASIIEAINERLSKHKVFLTELNHDPDFTPAEDFIKAVCKGTGVKFVNRGSRAFYTMETDAVTVPPKRIFNSIADYYQTAMHELMHSTQKKDRVGEKEGEAYDYAFRELVAEIGSCFLLLELGVPRSEKMLPQAQSYMSHWLEKMGGDPKYIFDAASQASKGVDFLLSFVGKANPPFVEEEAAEEVEESVEMNRAA